MSQRNRDNDVLLAVIGAPHGINGEVRVKSFTGAPEAFADYGPLHDASGNQFEVARTRAAKGVAITRFTGIATREAAEALNGTELFVTRDALPEPEEEEYYLADLLGLVAVSADGKAVGKVTAADNFGAGDVLEIAFDTDGRALFAFTRAIFPEIDLAGGRIVVIPPETVSERDPDGS